MKVRHLVVAIVAAAMSQGCDDPTAARRAMKPQSIVLLVTPKMIPDFDDPGPAIAAFLDRYQPLTSRGAETIVIFGVGNSDHILNYRGSDYWNDPAEWARLTDGIPVSTRTLDYNQIAGIVRAFKARATASGMNLKVYDLIDSGTEFTAVNGFKDYRHNECMTIEFLSYNVGARLLADDSVYASAPDGITAGTLCGHFLVDQTARYLEDLGFDGILYKNQLGFSFPADGYRHFHYLIASGFCVVTTSERYLDNLQSKLEHANGPRILATIDYVDPWYSYDSMADFQIESARLEEIAIEYRYDIDGIMFFAHDEGAALVPRGVVESFAARFFVGVE